MFACLNVLLFMTVPRKGTFGNLAAGPKPRGAAAHFLLDATPEPSGAWR